MVAVNAFGDVVNPQTGEILAGARKSKTAKPGDQNYFADTLKTMTSLYGRTIMRIVGHANTVIGVVATNAKLDKAQANKSRAAEMLGISRETLYARMRRLGLEVE